MKFQEKPTGIYETETDEKTSVHLPFMVILFNDDYHSFDEVITQLLKATKCSFDKARALTFEVHVKGKAIVFHGSLNDCLKVSSILEEIELHTQVVSEN